MGPASPRTRRRAPRASRGAPRPTAATTDDPGTEHRLGWTRERALAHLESPERMRSGEGDRLWSRVDLAPGEVVVDLGAGTGYFALPAARRVGRSGRVYAVDVSDELVALVAGRARRRRLPQLSAVRSDPARVPLPDRVADLVLLANVLHGFSDATLREAIRLLRWGGRFVVVEWDRRPTDGGPPLAIRLDPDAVAARLAGGGLVPVARGRLGPTQHLLVATRRKARPAPRR